ncbi:MAG: hypothetical protein QOI61_585 [Actinomycetota bacterium]|jgi:hypothetical protein
MGDALAWGVNVGKIRKLCAFMAIVSAVFGALSQPAGAGAQRAFCHSKGGTPATGANGIAQCWVDGVDIFAG